MATRDAHDRGRAQSRMKLAIVICLVSLIAGCNKVTAPDDRPATSGQFAMVIDLNNRSVDFDSPAPRAFRSTQFPDQEYLIGAAHVIDGVQYRIEIDIPPLSAPVPMEMPVTVRENVPGHVEVSYWEALDGQDPSDVPGLDDVSGVVRFTHASEDRVVGTFTMAGTISRRLDGGPNARTMTGEFDLSVETVTVGRGPINMVGRP